MIGDLEIEVPIIQGGMGVRVSVAPLAAAVANCGGGGTIASVGLPPDTEENRADVPKSCREHLQQEIRQARKLSDKVIGVNIMVALSNYEDMVRTAVKETGKEMGVKGKGLYMPLRIAVTGMAHGPDLSMILVIRGREDVTGSITAAIESISRLGG